MEVKTHLATSGILAALLYPYFGWTALLALAGGALIDIDHYFWFVYKTKSLSIKKCYYFYIIPFSKGDYLKHNGAFLVFHTIETLILSVLLSLAGKIFLAIFLGLLLHFTLDIIHRLTKLKMLFPTPPSIIGYVLQLRENND